MLYNVSALYIDESHSRRLIQMLRPTLLFGIAAIALLATGCKNSDNLATYETTGSVTYKDGQIVDEGTVIFVADGLPPGRAVIEEGEYSVSTYEPDDGAVAAKFRVAVTVNPPMDFDPDGGKKPPKLAKQKYSAPDTSGLEFEVTADGENRFNIVLEREK